MAYKQHSPDKRRSKMEIDLYEPIAPYESGFLKVDDTHDLYWEKSGNPNGVPVLVLHGGPGAGASPTHRRFFDPDHYNIIIFDQRGSGRSTPLGNLKNNTTEQLLGDIETLRKHFSIDHWHLFGGSWGSTLALAYAAQNPDQCISMVLRGIFLCEQEEINWFLYGMRNIFPEAWEQFTSILDDNEKDDLLNAYYKRLTSDDPKTQIEAGICWSLYEGACSSIEPNYEIITTQEQKDHSCALARIEAHYFLNEVRSPENSLLKHIETWKKIPTTIIQGRYDIICPIGTAYALHQRWPEAEYIVAPDAGHSALDPELRSRLVQATENAKRLT